MGINSSGYTGAFTKPVEKLIKETISGSVLHLFSGSSLIGDERIDISCPEATLNIPVEDFIFSDIRHWDWVILDPPYKITRTEKLKEYTMRDSLFGNVLFQESLKKYFLYHVDNILWLDINAPCFKPFIRQKLWLLLPGGFHTVRVLSWLKREMKPLL